MAGVSVGTVVSFRVAVRRLLFVSMVELGLALM